MKPKVWKAIAVVACLLTFISLLLWSVTGLLAQLRATRQSISISELSRPDSPVITRKSVRGAADSIFTGIEELSRKIDLLNKRIGAARKDTVYFVSTVVPDSTPSFGVYYPAMTTMPETATVKAPVTLQYRRDAAGYLVWTDGNPPLRIPISETTKLPWYKYFYFPVSFSAYGNSDVGAAAGVGFKRGAVMFGATTAGREIRIVYNFGGPFAH